MKVEQRPGARIEQALDACELFSYLTADERTRHAGHCALKDYRAGESLCLEGDRGTELYILVEGILEVFTHLSDGREIVLQRLDELGDYCGEQALRPDSDGRRGASVRAAQDAVVAIMPRRVFRDILARDPALEDSVAHRAKRIERQNRLLERSTMYRALVVFDQDQGWSREERFENGQVVFREGETGDKVYVIRSGKARVTRIEHGSPRLLAVLRTGQMFGELAVVESGTRQATVTADGTLEVISFDGARFRDAMAHNPEVHEYLKALHSVYRLDAGLVTQFDGEFLGEPALTTIYKLDDGREVLAHHMVQRAAYSATVDLPPDSDVESYAYEDARRNIRREIDVRDERIVRIHAEGPWSELGALHRLMIENEQVPLDGLETFAQSGHLIDVPEPLDPSATLCYCLNLTRGAIEARIARGINTLEALAERTGASTVCGGCTGRLASMVGSEGLPVKLVETIPALPDVRSFRFAPDPGEAGKETMRRALPGQHIVISAEIDDHWVHRPYTITSHPQETEYREITVKREPHGFFSGWLFDSDEADDAPFRMSHPKGKFWVNLDRPEPIVCLVAGIGVTPALAVARAVDANESGQRLHVDYSARTEQDFAFGDELDELADRMDLRVHYRCTGRGDRIGRDDVESVVRDYPDARFVVCGPEQFQEAVKGYLEACDIPDERVHVEVFTPVGHPPEEASPRSPAEHFATGMTLLLSFGYLAQWLLGWQWSRLAQLQQELAFQLVTGFVLLALIGYQWYLPWLRVTGRTRAAARHYHRHKYLGVVAPVLLYLHSQTMGYALLFVLASTFLANAVVGALDKTVFRKNRTRERYHRPWLAVHVSLSMMVAALSIWHLYFALAYK